MNGRSFGVSPGLPGRFDVTKLATLLEEVHERLSGVVIERLPWPELLRRYDREGSLFYLDPPYYGSETDYGAGIFSRDDFAVLADALAALRGRFILSLNDRPEVRRIFAAFQIEGMETIHSIGGGSRATRVAELLISDGRG